MDMLLKLNLSLTLMMTALDRPSVANKQQLACFEFLSTVPIDALT